MIIRVGTYGNNCGLFALGLATSLAIKKAGKIPSTVPLFIATIEASDVQNSFSFDSDRYSSRQLEIAQLMRGEIALAMQADRYYKQSRIKDFVPLCLSPYRPADMEAFIDGDQYIIPEIKRSVDLLIPEHGDFLLPPALATELQLDETVVNLIKDQLIDLMQREFTEINIAQILDPYCADMALENFFMTCVSFHKAWDRVSEADGSEVGRKNVKEFANDWFFGKAQRIFNTCTTDVARQRMLLALGRCRMFIGGHNEINFNAREIYAYFVVKERWEQIFKNYTDYVRSTDVMLSVDELNCLARAWKIDLAISVDGQRRTFGLLDPSFSPELSVAITNSSGIHWDVLADDTLEENINDRERKTCETNSYGLFARGINDFFKPRMLPYSDSMQTSALTSSKRVNVKRLTQQLDRLRQVKLTNFEQRRVELTRQLAENDDDLSSKIGSAEVSAEKQKAAFDHEYNLIQEEIALKKAIAGLDVLMREYFQESPDHTFKPIDLLESLEDFLSGKNLRELREKAENEAVKEKLALGKSHNEIRLQAEKKTEQTIRNAITAFEQQNANFKITLIQEQETLREITQKIDDLNKKTMQYNADLLEEKKKKKGIDENWDVAIQNINKAKQQRDDDLKTRGTIHIKLSSCSGPWDMENRAFIIINGQKQKPQGIWRGLHIAFIDSTDGAVVFSGVYDAHGSGLYLGEAACALDRYRANSDLIVVIVSSDESSYGIHKDRSQDSIKGRNHLVETLREMGSNDFDKLGYRDLWYFIKGPGIDGGAKECMQKADKEGLSTLAREFTSNAPGERIRNTYQRQTQELETARREILAQQEAAVKSIGSMETSITQSNQALEATFSLQFKSNQEIAFLKKSINDNKTIITLFDTRLKNCLAEQMKLTQQIQGVTQSDADSSHNADETRKNRDVKAVEDLQTAIAEKRTRLIVIQEELVKAKAQVKEFDNQQGSLSVLEKQFIDEAEWQHAKVKRSLQSELASVNVQLNSVAGEINDLLEMELLANDIVLSAFKAADDMDLVRRLIATILQGVFRRYPIYSLANLNNEIFPAEWQPHVKQIVDNAAIKDLKEINEQVLNAIVTAINAEYAENSVQITVNFHSNALEVAVGDKTDEIEPLNVYSHQDQFFLMVPSRLCYTAKEQAAELLKNLQLQGGALELLALEQIKAKLKRNLPDAEIEDLQHFLQTERVVIRGMNNFVEYLENISNDLIWNTNSHIALSMVNRLARFEKENIFSLYEIAAKFNQFRQTYLQILTNTIQREFLNRREAVHRLQEDDPLKQLEKQIHKKEEEIEEAVKKIEEQVQRLASKETHLVNLQLKAKQREASYQLQQKEVEDTIQKLREECDISGANLKALKESQETHQAEVRIAEDQQKENQNILEQLRTKQAALKIKCQNVVEELVLLNQHCEDLKREREILDTEKCFSDRAKQDAEVKRKTIMVLFGFIKNMQKTIINNGSFFVAKHKEWSDKVKEHRNSGINQFRDLYDYLIAQPEFYELKSAEVEAEAKNAELFFHECLDTLEEILRCGTASFDYTNNTFYYKGFNVSWRECYGALVLNVRAQLETYGLKFNAQGHLIVPDYIPRISDLPQRLGILIMERIQTKYRPDKLLTPKSDPQWNELYDQNQLKQMIEGFHLTLLEIMPCYIDAVDVIAGNYLFVEENICLPGIDLTLYANNSIELKPNCTIQTSTPDAPAYLELKAWNGADCRELQEPPIGRDGDNGLCGIAAKSAGHIYIHANNTIVNLDLLRCEAKGGKGANGQEGGDGDKGKNGKDTPLAETGDCPRNGFLGTGTSYMILAEARIPGVGCNGQLIPTEISGPGGEGGQAGWGGEGGLSGDIVVKDFHHEIRIIRKDRIEEFYGPNAEKKDNDRFQSESGEPGDDGLLNARGGEAGEAGYLGVPSLKIKKEKHWFFPGWRTDEYRNNYDIAKYKRMYRGRYRQSDFGPGYSHKYESTWYCESLPITSDLEARKSTDERSRGEDRRNKQNHRMVARNKRKETNSRINRLQKSDYQNALQQEAQQLSKLAAIKKLQQRVKTETRSLDEGISMLNAKITACQAGIAEKTPQIIQAVNNINAKTFDRDQLDHTLEQVNQEIRNANEQGKAAAEDLLTKVDALTSVTREAQNASLDAQCADVSLRAESRVKQRLIQLHNRLEQAIIFSQCETANQQTEIEAILAELERLKAIQEKELAQLKDEHHLKTIQQERLSREAEGISKYIVKAADNVQQTKQVTKQYKVSVTIKHEGITQTTLKMLFGDLHARKNANRVLSMKQIEEILKCQYESLVEGRQITKSARILITPIEWLSRIVTIDLTISKTIIGLLPKTYQKIKSWLSGEQVLEERNVAEKSMLLQHYRNFFITMTDWLQRAKSLSQNDLLSLWNDLLIMGNQIAETPLQIQTLLLPVYKELCMVVQEKSNEMLYSLAESEQMAATELDALKARIAKILYGDNEILSLTEVQEVRFRKYFYTYFLAKDGSRGQRLVHDLAKWPLVYCYKTEDSAVLSEQLQTILHCLEESDKGNQSRDVDELYCKLCKIIIDHKFKRFIDKSKRERASSESYSTLYKIFTYLQTSLLSDQPKSYILNRWYDFLQQEFCDLVQDAVLPNLAQGEKGADDFVTSLKQLQYDLQLVGLDPDEYLPEWLTALNKSSIQWFDCLLAISQCNQSEELTLLKGLIFDRINFLNLDSHGNEVAVAMNCINRIRNENLDIRDVLLPEITNRALSYWSDIANHIKHELNNDKVWDKFNAVLQKIMSMIVNGRSGLSEEEQLRRLVDVERLLANHSVIPTLITELSELAKAIVVENKARLTSMVGIDREILPDCFYQQILENLFNLSDDKMDECFEQYLFCLEHDTDTETDLKSLEQGINSHKDTVLQLSNKNRSNLIFGFLNQIDSFIDRSHLSTIKRHIEQYRAAVEADQQSFNDIENELKGYENYYRRSKEDLAKIEEDQKLFVRVLLLRLKDQKIDFSSSKDVAGLITLLNHAAIKKLYKKSDSLFECSEGPVEDLKNLREQLNPNANLNDLFNAWVKVLQMLAEDLQSAAESLQLAEFEPWMMRFVEDSNVLLRKVLFDPINQQRDMLYRAQQISRALTKNFTGEQSHAQSSIEQFAQRVKAYAYKADLYRNVDLMAADFEQSNHKSESHRVLEFLESNGLWQISLVLTSLRIIGDENKSRAQLVQVLISLLSIKKISAKPSLVFEQITQFIRQQYVDLIKQNCQEDEEATRLNELFYAAIMNNDIRGTRIRFGELFLQILTTNSKMSDLMDFTQALIDYIPADGVNHEPFLNVIFTALAKKYIEDLKLSCQQDKVLTQWIPAFGRFEALLASSPRQVLIAMVHLVDALKTNAFDKAIDRILFETWKTETKLSFIIDIANIVTTTQKITAEEAKQWLFLSCLLPFSKDNQNILTNSTDCLLEAYRTNRSCLRGSESIFLSFIVEASLCYVKNKFNNMKVVEHLSVLVNNLASECLEENILEQRNFAFTALGYLYEALKEHEPNDALEENFVEKILEIDNCTGKSEPDLLLKNLLMDVEQQYAKCLDKKDVREIIVNYFAQDYLKALKKAYWKSKISDPLWVSFSEKYAKARSFKDQEKFQKHFQKFLTTENYQLLELHYSDLTKLVNGLHAAEYNSDFFHELEPIYTFKKLLITSHSIAVAEHTEPDWLRLVDALLKHMQRGAKIPLLNKIFNLGLNFDSLDEIIHLVETFSGSELQQKLLFKFVQIGIDKQVLQENKEHEIHYLQLADKVFTSETGLRFLEIFGNALYQGNAKEVKLFSVDRFNQLVNELVKLSIYHEPELVEELAKRPLQYWFAVLKRRQLEMRLRLDFKNREHNRLLERLIGLQKEHNTGLFNEWISLIGKSNAIDYDVICSIFGKFSSREWVFEHPAFVLIKEASMSCWESILTEYFSEKEKTDFAERKAPQIAALMREDQSGINDCLASLLCPIEIDDKKRSLSIEEIVQHIHHRYKVIEAKLSSLGSHERKQAIIEKVRKEFNVKTRSGVGPHYFLRDGNREEIIEFLATTMYAVACAEKIEIRDTQLVALIAFISGFDQKRGRLAKISTGEGKTLITRIMAIAGALRGENVGIITSSKALAEPNAEEAEPLFEYFDLKVNNICDQACDKDEGERKKRYAECQVLYGDEGSFQRDMLLTDYFGKNLCSNPLNRLIVDEVDSMFIDNIAKVLYISHTIDDLSHLRSIFYFIWQCVFAKDTYFESEKNIDLIIKLFKKEYDFGTIKVPALLKTFVDQRLKIWVKNAYLAKWLTPEKEYSIMKSGEYIDKAIINDLPTGVEQFQSQWSHGLHQFVQLKHRKALTHETLRAVFISNVSFFNRYRETGCLNGMTGTLGSKIELNLLASIYGVDFFKVPVFKRERYIQEDAEVHGSVEKWLDGLLKNAREKIENMMQIEDEDKEEAEKHAKESLLLQQNLEKEVKTLEEEKVVLEQKINHARKKLAAFSHLIPHIASHGKDGQRKTMEQIKDERADKMRKRDMKEGEIAQLSAEIAEVKLSIAQKNEARSDYKAREENFNAIAAGRTSRAVLILCEDKDSAQKIHHYLKSGLQSELASKKANLYLYDSYLQKLVLNTEQVQPGDIIVATNIGGRGKDFEMSEQLANHEGLESVFSYMPSNIRIEEQGFRRAARKGQPGSGKFIVYDERASQGFVSIEQLRDERDELESIRLDEIQQIKIPRLDTEQQLSELFCDLQKEVRKKLQEKVRSNEIIHLQIKSLSNAWAFWFDAHDEMLENVYKTDKQIILDEFVQFKKRVLTGLNESQEMLIVESGELLHLAKQHMGDKNYHDAIRCYEKIIQQDPDFCGFAYYYLAQAIICTGSNSENKRRARTALKKSIPLFEAEVGRLSLANQIIRVVGDQIRSTGQGLSADLLTKTNVDEISIYHIHIQAVKDAIGTELTPDLFRTGEVVADEAKKLFDNLRAALSHQIKDLRLSRKVTIQKEEDGEAIFYNGKKIGFPTQFEYCKHEILDLLKTKVGQHRHEDRVVKPELFNEFILTADSLLVLLDSHVNQCDLVVPTNEADKLILGNHFWRSEEFAGYGERIKSVLSTLLHPMTKAQFVDFLNNTIDDNQIDWEKVCEKLKDQKVIKIDMGYRFKEEFKEKIKKYQKDMMVSQRVDIELGIKNLPLEKMQEFSEKAEKIREILRTSVKNKKAISANDFSAAGFQLSDQEFNQLRLVLQGYGLLENRLATTFGLDSAKVYHHRFIEEAILLCSRKDFFSQDDFGLLLTNNEATSLLFSQLAAARVVHEPAVFFPSVSDSEIQIKYDLDSIRRQVVDKIDAIVAGILKDLDESTSLSEVLKRSEDAKRIKDAVCEALEKSIGSLRTIHKVKLENRSLEAYYVGQPLPPVVVEYMNSAISDVLNLILDKNEDFWDWDAFWCAMIGVAQIIAGVMLSAVSPFLGELLISEGISDITFAVMSMVNGNFSWQAYGEHKMQSLTISILCIGVGGALSEGSTVATEGSTGAKQGLNLSKSITKELGKAAIQTVANVSTNMAMSKISETVVQSLFDDFKQTFKGLVLKRSSSVLNSIKQHSQTLFKKLPMHDAAAVFSRAVQALNVQKVIESDVSSFALRAIEAISGKLAGLKKTEGKKDTLSMVGSIASLVCTFLEIDSYRRAVNDIVQTSIQLFDRLETSLKHAIERFEQQNNGTEIPQAELDALIDTKLEAVIDDILNQMQVKVQQVFQRAGTQGVNLALRPLIEGAKTRLSESIDELYDNPHIKQGQDALQTSRMTENPMVEDVAVLIESGEIVDADMIAETGADRVITAAGEKNITELQRAVGDRQLHYTVKDQQFYLLEQDFSGDALTNSLLEGLNDFDANFGDDDGFSLDARSLGKNRYFLLGENQLNHDSGLMSRLAIAHLSAPIAAPTDIKGLRGEQAASAALKRAGYIELSGKIKGGSNNGFDGVFVKYKKDGTIADLIVVESKYSKTGFSKMSQTKTKGLQGSAQWIEKNIELLRTSKTAEVRAVGEILQRAKEQGILRFKTNVLDPDGVNLWRSDRIINFKPNQYTHRTSPIIKTAPAAAFSSQPVVSSSAVAAETVAPQVAPTKTVIPKGVRNIYRGVTFFGIFNSANNIYTQYTQDKSTGNFHKTHQVAASEAGCWAGGFAGAKAGALAGSFFPGPVTVIGGVVGGLGGCYIGSQVSEKTYTKIEKRNEK